MAPRWFVQRHASLHVIAGHSRSHKAHIKCCTVLQLFSTSLKHSWAISRLLVAFWRIQERVDEEKQCLRTFRRHRSPPGKLSFEIGAIFQDLAQFSSFRLLSGQGKGTLTLFGRSNRSYWSSSTPASLDRRSQLSFHRLLRLETLPCLGQSAKCADSAKNLAQPPLVIRCPPLICNFPLLGTYAILHGREMSAQIRDSVVVCLCDNHYLTLVLQGRWS